MAIKISGTTVIDNSCNVTNANTFTATTFVGDGAGLTGITPPAAVLKPENTNPADGATGVSVTPTLCGSEYLSLYDKTHTCSCFQVSIDSGFSNTEFTCEVAGACTSLTVPADCLGFSTQHFFRLRYEDADGCCSEFSNPTCFTTQPALEVLGSSTCGGFYIGTICAVGSCYYLIVAPNSVGSATCQYKTTRTCSGVGCTGDALVDGFGNTYDHLDNTTHPAGNWTATRTIAGFTDWYLPSICELRSMYDNCGCLPSGEEFPSNCVGSSTERVADDKCDLDFVNGNTTNRSKGSFCAIRATRRIPF